MLKIQKASCSVPGNQVSKIARNSRPETWTLVFHILFVHASTVNPVPQL